LAATLNSGVLLKQKSVEVILILLTLNIEGEVGALVHVHYFGFLVCAIWTSRVWVKSESSALKMRPI
jgi:hypothetical protein